mmetsp:Transcript_21089/g.23522  ORF Transcript_21089/g.23522 Transcript_21089/m.23522 type:complete len:231 (-) Transcript_21089:89-781(-)
MHLNNYSFTVLTAKHKSEAIKVMTDGFYRGETECVTVGASRDAIEGYFTKLLSVITSQGLSTVAIERSSGKVVGARLALDMALEAPSKFECIKMAKEYSSLYKTIYNRWISTHKLEASIKGVWVKWAGISVDINHSRRGIATMLYKTNFEHITGLGYKGALVVCSSKFSGAACEKRGYKLVGKIAYADYEVNGQFPFKDVKPPHKYYKMFEATTRDFGDLQDSRETEKKK